MDKQFKTALNGVEVRTDDLDLLGESSGRADDRLIATLFRMPLGAGGSVSKCIIPYEAYEVTAGVPKQSTKFTLTGAGSVGTDRNVYVSPFRAVISSRTTDDSTELIRDIRSGIHWGSSDIDSTNGLGYTRVLPTNNTSGFARWDAIYAIVTLDDPSPVVTRKVKDIDTNVVTSTSVSVYMSNTVTIGIATGTPSAAPALPSIPADSSTVFNILLGYVAIRDNTLGDNFGLDPQDFLHQAPFLPEAKTTGVVNARPSTSNSKTGSVALTTTRMAAWCNDETRSPFYLPPHMTGEDVLYITVDCTNVSSSNWSHTDGSVVDNSRDWGGRVFTWQVYANVGEFAWVTGDGTSMVPQASGAENSNVAYGWGQSFFADSGPNRIVLHVTGGTGGNLEGSLDSGQTFKLYSDPSTGELKASISGQLDSRLIIRLCASSSFNLP